MQTTCQFYKFKHNSHRHNGLPDALLPVATLSSIRNGGWYLTNNNEDSTILTLDAAMAIPASIGAKAK